jgi:hypothetical protein
MPLPAPVTMATLSFNASSFTGDERNGLSLAAKSPS